MSNANQVWAKIVAKAWSDETFKEELLDNPEAVCQRFGLEVPPGAVLYVHEASPVEVHLNLPAKPEGVLSEEQLQEFASASMGPLAICGVIG